MGMLLASVFQGMEKGLFYEHVIEILVQIRWKRKSSPGGTGRTRHQSHQYASAIRVDQSFAWLHLDSRVQEPATGL